MYAFEKAPRCSAKTKSNYGRPCRCPAVKGKMRCRVHGGAKRSGAPLSNINALKHGQTTSKVKEFKFKVRCAIQQSKKIISEFN